MIVIIIEFFMSFIELFLEYKLLGIYFPKRPYKTLITFTLGILVLINTIIKITFNSNPINVLVAVLLSLIIAFILYEKDNISKKICILVHYFLFYLILNMFIWLSIITIYKSNKYYIDKYNYMLYFLQVLYYSIFFIVIRILKNKYINTHGLKGNFANYLLHLIIPTLSIAFIVVFYNFELTHHDLYSEMNYIVFFVFLSINIVCFIIFHHMERLYIKSKESDIINLKLMMKEQHYIEVEVQNEKIRKFKHDIHNQLVVINNYVQNEFYNDAQDILSSLIKDVDIATYYNFSQNRVINTLINVKYNLMKKEFIIFEYNIKVPSKISILDKDLIAIISNILDNAIEATVKCPLSNRKISMNILYYNGALVINSKNNIQKMVVDLETHKRNILEHGLGLKSLFGCVNQYNGVYNWQSNNSEFEINIIMCDQKR